MMNRDACLKVLAGRREPGTVVVTNMAAVAPWAKLSNTALDFPFINSAMSHGPDFAMGLALARPRRPVWVLNGDGCMLMNLGHLVTLRQTPPPNLVLFVLQNDTFEVTGNQPIPGAGAVCFEQLARGAGFEHVHDFDSTERLQERLAGILRGPGPIFINLRIEKGTEPAPMLEGTLRTPASELRAVLAAGD